VITNLFIDVLLYTNLNFYTVMEKTNSNDDNHNNSHDENDNKVNKVNKEDETLTLDGELQRNDENKIKSNLKVTRNFLMFNVIEGDLEILIPYRDIIFFAVNNEQGFLIMEYNSHDSEDGDLIKFYSDSSQELYDKIQNFNILHENEEFREEPEGENELFTAENLK
jgi:hypothetical protein